MLGDKSPGGHCDSFIPVVISCSPRTSCSLSLTDPNVWDFRGSCGKGSLKDLLKEISLEYSSEGLMFKLKLQYFGHLMQRADSLEKTLMLGKIESGRRG